ncbi:MAG: L-2-hydroxyglutarate oxidase LhgO, partial [Oleispira sp.]
MENFDYCIIGAGVVGLAIAFKLSKRLPRANILLIESHHQFGTETSSRNSEVIHAGIYYSENSLKAELCLNGAKQL